MIFLVVIKPCCDTDLTSKNMENSTSELTRDLNMKDGVDLEKKHNCDQCNYSTARADNLKTHKGFIAVRSLSRAHSANILAHKLAT